MANSALLSAAQNFVANSKNGESFALIEPELYAAAAHRKINLRGYRMGPLSQGELLLYLDVLQLESNAVSEINLATLNTVMKAHLEHIPFQGIETFVGRQPPMDDDSIFRKLIEQRRGGFCIELNNLFGRLLLTLGFKFHIRAARIRWGRPLNTPLTPLGHLLLCVDLDEEGQYFADVGFGGPNPFKALPVEGEAGPYRVQRIGEQGYVEVAIKSTARGGASVSWRPLYHVFPHPQKWIDFIPQYWYGTLHPRSLFLNVLMVGRFVDGSWLTLVDGRFCRRSVAGQVEQRFVTDVEEVMRLLETEFTLKLDPDMDLDFLRSRIRSAIRE
ncbi:hypothetical protein HPB50_023842 [Hyalomma asiaticum]|uniref:Uncharacterized protein n=1 Tax=Hyalomma asiaticum TaxID=266040 RepID=A0ACB7S1R2_HYAAI|nr:hypothetical protein HPB50_023842 [Hyalomma asiaticum]